MPLLKRVYPSSVAGSTSGLSSLGGREGVREVERGGKGGKRERRGEAGRGGERQRVSERETICARVHDIIQMTNLLECMIHNFFS